MASVYPNRAKGKWYLRFKDPHGRWRSRSSGIEIGDSAEAQQRSRRRAEAMLDKLVAQLTAAVEIGEGGPLTVRRTRGTGSMIGRREGSGRSRTSGRGFGGMRFRSWGT